ncbi:hypothetical protein LEMLEM_LOCUS936 [Lemmus lemmus]
MLLSVKSPSKAPLLWVRIGYQMNRMTPSQDCATLTGSSAVTTTMGTTVPACARSAMTSLDTTCASQMAACPACPVGLGNTAISVSSQAPTRMEGGRFPPRKYYIVVSASLAAYAMNVSPTMAVVMAPAAVPGSVPVMRAGEVCSVTKISITAPTTPHARMGQRAPTAGSGVTPVPAARATLVWTASWNSASVTATLVGMAAAVRTRRMDTTACVPQAIMVSTVNTVP